MRLLVIKFIELYQRWLSPDHSFWAKRLYPYGYCRFHPSCSEYIRQSVQEFGVMLGVVKGVKRIVKCNPWHPGGVDPVKHRTPKNQRTEERGVFRFISF